MSTTPPEKVKRLGIQKERGYLYYLDADSQVCRVKLEETGRQPKAQPEVVIAVQIEKASGYLYFIDADGDISRSKV